MFKGTQRRPTARAIARELDGMGSEYNAFTSKDWTGYYVKAAAEHFDRAFEIMADILTHSKFSSETIKKERHVILEEMRMYRDNPLLYIEDLFESRIYGRTPLGRDIAGTNKSVLATTRKSLMDYFELHYQPRNMVFIAAGAINPPKVLEHVKKHFGHLKPKRRLPYFTCKFHQVEPQLNIYNRPTEQAQVALGFPGYHYSHQKLTSLEVLHGILGAGPSSRLFESIREQKGLAYTVRTNITSYEDTGAFYVRAGMDPKKTEKALSFIIKEFISLKERLVTREELKRAKQYLNGALALELEESDAYASWVAKQALFLPKVETIDELHDRVNAVTREQVREVARDVMDPNKINLALIGPFKSEKPYEKLLRTMR